MRAFLFSGQGSQKVGMAGELIASSPAAAALYREASALAGSDIAAFTADELGRTVNTQLAVAVYSAALWAALPATVKQDAVLAGFSLGEYSALYAAGVVDLTGLVRLILWRSRFMQDVINSSAALGMAAVIGLPAADVERVLAEQQAAADPAAAVYAVNFNSPDQTVISGATATIDKLKRAFLAAGAGRVLPLRVAGAFHSPYFAGAAAKLAEQAAALTFNRAVLPIYSNVTGARLPAEVAWPAYLQQSLASPVYFTAELAKLATDGVTEMFECGPGSTLLGFVRKTLPDMPARHASELLA